MPIVTDGSIEDTLPLTNLPIIFWRNIITTSLVSTAQGTDDPSFPISNVANASLSNKWKQDFTGSPVSMPDFIEINSDDLGPINYIAIAGHNFGTIGATVAVEAYGVGQDSPDAPSPGTDQITEVITGYRPADDSPLIFMFYEVENELLRLRIESPGVTAAEIAVLFVGKATVMAEGIQADHTPLPLAKRNNVVLGNSENGSFLGRIVLGDWAESSASFANLTKEWVREELLDFLDYAAEFPFFYAWSPLTYPEEVAFAYLNNDPLPIFDIDGYGRVDLDMKGIIE